MEKRMFHEDLFGESDNGAYLLGKKCLKCGNIQFPQKGFCQKCLNENMVDLQIGKKGTLFSYTTTYGRVSKLKGPFDVGYIMLEEGIRIFAPIKKSVDQEYQIGQEMELEIIDLWTLEEEGVMETGYGYKVAK